MEIPSYVLSTLALTPPEQHVSLFMRHSIRYPIIDPAETLVVGLTPEGVELAEEFGNWLGEVRRPGRIMTSPVGRCIDTGVAIGRGAGWSGDVTIEDRLGFPFIQSSWDLLLAGAPIDDTPKEAWQTLNLLLEDTNLPGGVNIYITHDCNVAYLARCLLGDLVTEANWPDFLEGLVVWREDNQARIVWRGKIYEVFSSGQLAYQDHLF
ncbi:MAG: histidine phosphatase family protein [Planctomycetes bacterium]|nr:histidine phosphatase family protein [Planctomycetota bacterium]